MSNETWAMTPETMNHIAEVIRTKRPEFILELGSGESTVKFAEVLRELDAPYAMYSVDHDPTFALRTKQLLQVAGLEGWAEVALHPLVDGWYDLDFQAPVDMLIVDGPPGNLGTRAPAVPNLYDVLRPGAVVFLDDALREAESAALELWATEFEWGSVGLQVSGRGLGELWK
jgi:predicted O-methyltransferase YrrM